MVCRLAQMTTQVDYGVVRLPRHYLSGVLNWVEYLYVVILLTLLTQGPVLKIWEGSGQSGSTVLDLTKYLFDNSIAGGCSFGASRHSTKYVARAGGCASVFLCLDVAVYRLGDCEQLCTRGINVVIGYLSCWPLYCAQFYLVAATHIVLGGDATWINHLVVCRAQ